MRARTSIVLVDDHQVVRQGLRLLLEAEPGFAVVGEASEGSEAVELVERLRPQVLIVDLMLPGLNGLEVTRRCAGTSRIVILTMHASEGYASEALRQGATAYVLKDSSASDLIRAVREASAGRRYLSPPLSESALDAYARKEKAVRAGGYDALTARERQVLLLVAEGQSSRQIAQDLAISPRTAEAHRANVMRKLRLRNRAELVRYALRRRLLPLDDEDGADRLVAPAPRDR